MVLVGREAEVLEWRAVIVDDWRQVNLGVVLPGVQHVNNEMAEIRVLYSESWSKLIEPCLTCRFI